MPPRLLRSAREHRAGSTRWWCRPAAVVPRRCSLRSRTRGPTSCGWATRSGPDRSRRRSPRARARRSGWIWRSDAVPAQLVTDRGHPGGIASPDADQTHPHHRRCSSRAARRRHGRPTTQYLSLAARHTPVLAIERGGDTELPVDFRICRAVACAQSTTRPGAVPARRARVRASCTSSTGSTCPDVAVRPHAHPADRRLPPRRLGGRDREARDDGAVVGARATAHLGFNGVRPWWDLAASQLGALPRRRSTGRREATAGRSGHVTSTWRATAWNGTARTVRPGLVAADVAARAGARFDPGAVAPWAKQAWSDPETVITGHPATAAATPSTPGCGPPSATADRKVG